jgi:kynureninase
VTREEALRLDSVDPLKERRKLFVLPESVIYLDGNSLGPPTYAALKRIEDVARREWGHGLIRSWNEAGWIDLPRRAGAKIAPLIGAAADEVIVCDSVSVNLFKLAAALAERMPDAPFAIDDDEFPTDRYVVDGLARLVQRQILTHSGGPFIAVKSLVHYKTAAIADMRADEARAKERGGAIVWDLSHAAGVVDVNVGRDGARFAVGCGYKFLSGGPGAPAFLYVRRDEADRLRQPLAGWMGHAAPFDFAADYRPADGVARFAAGTPNILSLAAMDAALGAFDHVDMAQCEKKARALGDLFLDRAHELNLQSVTPADARRAGHVGLRFAHGRQTMQALIARGIIGDFRPPDVMRFGFSPLYNTYAEVFDAAAALVEIVETGGWREARFATKRLVP